MCHSLVAFLFASLLVSLPVARSESLSESLNPRSTCYSGAYILTARGTGEPQDGSRLNAIASAISAVIPDSYTQAVVYPASQQNFYSSVSTGVQYFQQQINDYIGQCPNGQIVALGYSQGALAMQGGLAGTNLTSEHYTGLAQSVGKNVAAVVFFGDPTRVPGQGVNDDATPCTTTSPLEREGPYQAAMDFYADRLQDWCNVNDPVCCSTGTDGSTHLSYFTQTITDTVVQFVKQNVQQAGNSTSSSAATSSGASSTWSTTSSTSASSTASSSSATSTISSAWTGSSTSTTSTVSTTSSAASSSGTVTGSVVPASSGAAASPSLTTSIPPLLTSSLPPVSSTVLAASTTAPSTGVGSTNTGSGIVLFAALVGLHFISR